MHFQFVLIDDDGLEAIQAPRWPYKLTLERLAVSPGNPPTVFPN